MRLRPLEYFRRIWRRSWPVSVKAPAFYSTVPFGVISALAFVLICSDIFAPFLPADFTTSCNPGTGVGVLEEMNKAFAEFMAHLIGLQGSSRKVIRKAGTLAPIAEEDEEVADAEDVDPCQMPSDRYGPLLKVLNILVYCTSLTYSTRKECAEILGEQDSVGRKILNAVIHFQKIQNCSTIFF